MKWWIIIIGVLIIGSMGYGVMYFGKDVFYGDELNEGERLVGGIYPVQDKNISIGSGNSWLWTHQSGQEAEIMFAYVHEQNNPRTQICAVQRDGVPPGQIPQSINVYDSDENFLYAIDKELIDIDDPLVFHKWGFCRSVEGEVDPSYLRFGENSIIFEWLEIAMIQFENDFVQINTSLLWISPPNQTGMNDIFLIEEDIDFKFGANHTGTQSDEVNRYKYIVKSSQIIEEYGYGVYVIKRNQSIDCYQNPFEAPMCDDPKYDFTDIIEAFEFDYVGQEENYTCNADDYWNENQDCVVTFNTNVTFSFTDETNKTLEVEFNAKHNDSLGFTRIDPTITFSTNDIESIEMDVIDDDQYIIIWCDETADDTTFAVYYTNSTIITPAKDIDTGNGGCVTGSDYQADISILDKPNTLASAVWIGSSQAPLTAVFDYLSPPAFITSKVVATGRTTAISNTRLNDTAYAISWIDSTNRDASAILMNEIGDNITAIFDMDTEIGSPANAIASTSFTGDDQNFSVIWFDNNANNIQFVSLMINLSDSTTSLDMLIPIVIVDTSITAGNGAVSIDSFNETALVVGWLEEAILRRIMFATYYFNGTIITSETSIESNPGASTSISVSTLNSTAFAESWHDATDTDTNFEIWDIDGIQLVDHVIAFGSIVDGAQEVISTNSNDGICRNNLVVASTVPVIIGRGGQTKTFLTNGTLWDDGECPCSYAGGNFEPPCDCEITENIVIEDNANVTIVGEGITSITANLTGWTDFEVHGDSTSAICQVNVFGGGSISV